MNNGLERVGGLVAAYFMAAVVAVMGAVQMAGAQEDIPCPPCVGERLVCEHPILAHLPQLPFADGYLHRVIVNDKEVIIHLTKLPQPGSLLQETCSNQTCCEELLERLGLKEFTRQHEEGWTAKFLRLGCPCSAMGECACVAASGGNACAAAGCVGCKCEDCDCENCVCAACPGKGDKATCGADCAAASLVAHHSQNCEESAAHDPLALMQHIARLMAEKAAAEAALEVRRETAEHLGELFEAMAEILADNAALDARLQAQAEQTKLVEKMAELAAENARLKAHVELAAERMELHKSTFSLTLENEQLKLRLAHLEERHAEVDAARTAAKPKADRKAR